MSYNGWKKVDKVIIVYSVSKAVKFLDKEYKKAYVVEDGNEKQLESAIFWAEAYLYNRETGKTDVFKPKFVTANNSDFSLTIISAASGSSQGGKLSFWECLIEKDGIEPFVVGINSDLLCDFIIETTLVNGKSTDEVFFARKSGQLGVLHSGMSSYKELVEDENRRKSMSKRKTSKWKIGYEYDTLTCSDVMFGWFYDPLEVSTDWWYNRRNVLSVNIDFTVDKYPVYSSYGGSNFSDKIVQLLSCMHCYGSADKCPARQEGKMVFEETDDYYKKVVDVLLEDSKNIDSNWSEFGAYNKFFSILRYSFKIFKYDIGATLKILYNLRDSYVEFFKLPDFSKVEKFNVFWKSGEKINRIYTVYTWEDFMNAVADVVKMEMSNNGEKTYC